MTEGWATYAEGILLPLNTNLYTDISDKQILLQKYGVIYYQVHMTLLLLTCFTLGSLRPPWTFFWLVKKSSGTRHKLLRGRLYSGCVNPLFLNSLRGSMVKSIIFRIFPPFFFISWAFSPWFNNFWNILRWFFECFLIYTNWGMLKILENWKILDFEVVKN